MCARARAMGKLKGKFVPVQTIKVLIYTYIHIRVYIYIGPINNLCMYVRMYTHSSVCAYFVRFPMQRIQLISNGGLLHELKVLSFCQKR